MITFKQKGDFSKTLGFLESCKHLFNDAKIDEYGRLGVQNLAYYTPKDTGLTAASWKYKVERTNEGVNLVWYNTNIQNGQNIAIILQYGYTTRTGKYVEGRDYINPAIQPIFDAIAEGNI